MTRTPAVEAVGLTKSFNDVQALAGLDLVAPAGKVTAVLGPNGAGKSTFVRAVATLLRLDEGQLIVEGIDAHAHPEQVRRVIGLAGQNAAVEPALTGRENLVMVGRMFGHSKAAAAQAAAVVLARDRGSPTMPTAWSRATRAGCDAGSTWAPAWSGRPGCCCSTSPPPAWTPGPGWSCGSPSARSWRRAPTSCSPRSTWRRPTSWPTTS